MEYYVDYFPTAETITPLNTQRQVAEQLLRQRGQHTRTPRRINPSHPKCPFRYHWSSANFALYSCFCPDSLTSAAC